ncbi:MAG: uracil-DNA glycosylase [Victivallaceae bacterium]
MNSEFYRQLTDAIDRAATGSRAVELDAAVWAEFRLDAASSPPPPVRPVPVEIRGAPPVRPVPPAPPRDSGAAAAAADLAALAELVRDCRKCVLCEQRSHTVFGEGNPAAELMFVGEGPGAEEDASGRPFVGAAGQLLDKMIAAMTFRREDVYIANVVKCRPPGNRAPLPDEMGACLAYLRRQIELIRPKVIVALGGTAMAGLLGGPVSITRIRGQWTAYQTIPLMPTFHPAYLLRREEAKREVWSDLQQVMKALGRKRENGK